MLYSRKRCCLTRRLIIVRHWRVSLAEFLGSGGLAAVVVGSGIAAQRLSPSDVGVELLENAIVTGLGLFVLIVVFAPVSGAHFNPVVSLVEWSKKRLSTARLALVVVAQTLGCVAGVMVANVMFSDPIVSWSTNHRASVAHLLSEVIATAGLITVIGALDSTGNQRLTPAAVGCYIGAAYWWTSSTSFANPAITVGRMFSNTFAGIAPASVIPFVLAQLVGALLGALVVRSLFIPPTQEILV